MRWLTVIVVCLFSFSVAAQSSTTTDSFTDSHLPGKEGQITHQASTKDSITSPPDYSPASNKRKLDLFLQELVIRESRYRQQMYMLWGLGIVFTAVLVFILVRKRRSLQED